MDLDIFKIDYGKDDKLLVYIKQEAVAYINSIKEDYKESVFIYFKSLLNAIESCSSVGEGFRFIKTLCRQESYIENFIPLTDIDINEKSFIKQENSLRLHERSENIIWNSNFALDCRRCIINKCAYNIHIKKSFDFINFDVREENSQYSANSIYISKGGVINGDFIDTAFFNKEDYASGKLSLKLPITIPVAVVYYKDDCNNECLIYVVDHREPTLKQLQEDYDCPVCNDAEIAKYKLNLRNCKNKTYIKKDYTSIEFDEPKEFDKNRFVSKKNEDGSYTLSCHVGDIATWNDGHLTIYHSKVRYKKLDGRCWIWFTGYTYNNLKQYFNNGNNNITFK